MLARSMEAMYIFDRNVKSIVIVANNMEFPLKFKIELPYDPAILCLGLYPNNRKSE